MKAAMERVESAELFLSSLLRTGVFASALIILVGILLLFATQAQTGYMARGIDGLITYPPQAATAPISRSIADVINGLRSGEPEAIISLGLLVLIATPIVRVAVSVVLFVLQKDYRYVAITLFVLVVLLMALMLGAAE